MAACLVLAIAASGACRTRSVATSTDAGGDAGARPCAAPGACAADEYCAFEPRLCGKGKRPGTCRPKRADCPDAYAPACGCDGKVYENACTAHAAGMDLNVNGGCRERIPDWIACGPTFCDAHRTYCEIVLSDVFELPTDYACRPLPPVCLPEGGVARTCDCFPAGTRCRSFCGDVETGGLRGFHLTCRL